MAENDVIHCWKQPVTAAIPVLHSYRATIFKIKKQVMQHFIHCCDFIINL